MKKKQIIGIVVAAAAFIVVCASSMLTTQLSSQIAAQSTVDVLSTLSESTGELVLPEEPFVGLVRVEGTIMDAGSSTMFETVTYDHQGTLDYIDQMMKSESCKRTENRRNRCDTGNCIGRYCKRKQII